LTGTVPCPSRLPSRCCPSISRLLTQRPKDWRCLPSRRRWAPREPRYHLHHPNPTRSPLASSICRTSYLATRQYSHRRKSQAYRARRWRCRAWPCCLRNWRQTLPDGPAFLRKCPEGARRDSLLRGRCCRARRDRCRLIRMTLAVRRPRPVESVRERRPRWAGACPLANRTRRSPTTLNSPPCRWVVADRDLVSSTPRRPAAESLTRCVAIWRRCFSTAAEAAARTFPKPGRVSAAAVAPRSFSHPAPPPAVSPLAVERAGAVPVRGEASAMASALVLVSLAGRESA